MSLYLRINYLVVECMGLYQQNEVMELMELMNVVFLLHFLVRDLMVVELNVYLLIHHEIIMIIDMKVNLLIRNEIITLFIRKCLYSNLS